jgi:hypothetical protein
MTRCYNPLVVITLEETGQKVGHISLKTNMEKYAAVFISAVLKLTAEIKSAQKKPLIRYQQCKDYIHTML